MLSIDNTALLVIDVQGKLADVMHNKENLFANLKRMISGAKTLNIPILWTEQVPEKLGDTTPEIAELLQGVSHPVSKVSFSCCGNRPFVKQLTNANRQQILLTGIETHVCVYQTAVDLIDYGYEVELVTDAVASRQPENKQRGINRIHEAGAKLTSTEMALFELLRKAEGPEFKAISRLVK